MKLNYQIIGLFFTFKFEICSVKPNGWNSLLRGNVWFYLVLTLSVKVWLALVFVGTMVRNYIIVGNMYTRYSTYTAMNHREQKCKQQWYNII